MLNKKIKNPTRRSGQTETRPSTDKINTRNDYPSFRFDLFTGNCVAFKNSGFYNFYETDREAARTVSGFFDSIKEISSHTIPELERDNINRYHCIKERDKIVKIDKILSEYGHGEKEINNLEQQYVQFKILNGSRVICARFLGGLHQILFIDSNHLIYDGSSRNPGRKKTYSAKGYFTEDELEDRKLSYEQNELTKEFLGEIENYTTREEIVEHLKFIHDN